MPAWDDLVIYEMHVGTFARARRSRGTFDGARRRLRYLEHLGVSAVQVMPPFEFAGDISWGYNPAHLFAIESGYGGPDAFKAFVREAHAHGIAVIVDVVYNHLGPSDLDLWRFDGWAEGDGGGIYFYNDERGRHAVGRDPARLRPRRGPDVPARQRDDLARGVPVRRPPLRFDRPHPDRRTGYPAARIGPLPDGWSFLAWINDEIRARQPWKITIAEDLEDDPILVTPTAEGGAGFAAQWDAGFIRRVRPQLEAADDAARDMDAVVGRRSSARAAATPLSRVIYTESHDEVANGLVRVPEAIAPGDARQLVGEEAGRARLRARPDLARDPDAVPGPGAARGRLVRRHRRRSTGRRRATNRGIVRLHRDLIALRRARGRHDRAASAARTSRSSGPTRRPRSSSCTAG